jgi:hypothetical protein
MAKNQKKRNAPKVEQITGPQGPPPKPVSTHPSDEEIELEIRRYVKRNGGFRKDLPEDDIKRAQKLLKRLGRSEPSWDLKLIP